MSNTIGNKIRTLRKNIGFTQKQLAESANISEIAIKKYEKDIINPKYSTLEKIANALKVSTLEFLSLEEQIKEQFEEHFNEPQKTNMDLELETMLNTLDIKLAVCSMLTNFKCFKDLIDDFADEKYLELLSETIGANIISTINGFNKLNMSLYKKNCNLENENKKLKDEAFELNNKISKHETISIDDKENIIYEPFKTLEEQQAFEKSLENEIEQGLFETENS